MSILALTENTCLSWPARGMALYLMAQPDPDDCIQSVAGLVEQTRNTVRPSGRDAVYSLLRELRDAGVIVTHRRVLGSGKFGASRYTITARPTAEPAFLEACDSLTWRARGVLGYARFHDEVVTRQLVMLLAGTNQFGRDSASATLQELADGDYLTHPDATGSLYIKGKISEPIRQAVLKRDGYRCVECESIKRLSVDHILPARHGGTSDMANLQTLCRPCNSEKKDRMPEGANDGCT